MKIKLLQDYCTFSKGEIFEISKVQVFIISEFKPHWGGISNIQGSEKLFEFIEEENQNKENGTITSLRYSNDLLREELKSLQDQNETIKKENEDLNKLKSESEDWIIKLRSEVSCSKFSGENNLIKDLTKLIEVSK